MLTGGNSLQGLSYAQYSWETGVRNRAGFSGRVVPELVARPSERVTPTGRIRPPRRRASPRGTCRASPADHGGSCGGPNSVLSLPFLPVTGGGRPSLTVLGPLPVSKGLPQPSTNAASKKPTPIARSLFCINCSRKVPERSWTWKQRMPSFPGPPGTVGDHTLKPQARKFPARVTGMNESIPDLLGRGSRK
jgi:hypothetical protein